MDTLEKLRKIQAEFARERDWDKYHIPKNLAMALSVEASELVEIFQWLNNDEIKTKLKDEKFKESIEDEIADILLYLIRIAEIAKINIKEATLSKIEKNRKKYPLNEGNNL
tara:strand:- start:422 stop:754 length:333 start_codon:yes stop_codon:yes gene_type:complete